MNIKQTLSTALVSVLIATGSASASDRYLVIYDYYNDTTTYVSPEKYAESHKTVYKKDRYENEIARIDMSGSSSAQRTKYVSHNGWGSTKTEQKTFTVTETTRD